MYPPLYDTKYFPWPKLEALRQTAEPSCHALYAGDFVALGQAMGQNTEAQRNLHPFLVSPDSQRIIEIAQAHGALGWKVNGAGGDGGSITLLCGPNAHAKRAARAHLIFNVIGVTWMILVFPFYSQAD